MARNFKFKNRERGTIKKIYERVKWQARAYPENGGVGPVMIKDFNFVELQNYGLIDNENYSVVPRENYLVYLNTEDPLTSPRVFDFVADALALMKMNFAIAANKNLFKREGAAFADFTVVKAYSNPRLKYDEYLSGILSVFNDRLSQNFTARIKITSYQHYVNAFLKLIKNEKNYPITMSRYNKSVQSNILDSGLAIKYFDMPYDADQRKINEIIDHESFPYFKNLCLNFGFSIAHNNPNILVYDVASPAANSLLRNRQIFNLDRLFATRYTRTYLNDMEYIINNINIYYNKFAIVHPRTKVVTVKCRKTVSTFISRERVSNDFSPFSEKQLLSLYTKIRNIEEGFPFTNQKVNEILRKAKYFQKKFDNLSAIGYISNIFKDQVWNKNYGYDDSRKRLQGKPTARSSRIIRGEGSIRSPSGGGTSSGY